MKHVGAVCAIVAMLFTLRPAGAQQTVILRESAAPGDVWAADEQEEMWSKVTVHVGGRSATVPVTSQEREQYTARVLAIDGSGQPSALRLAFAVSRTAETGPDGTTLKEEHPYQRRVVTVRRVGRKTTVSVDHGKLSAAARQDLAHYLDADDSKLLPGREVAIGDQWSIDPDALRQMFGGARQVSGTGKLDSFVERLGHHCACIKFQFDATAMRSGPATADTSISGYGYFAMDINRMVGVEVGGPLSMRGSFNANGLDVPIEGTGDLSIREDERWIKIAGKAVAPHPGT